MENLNAEQLLKTLEHCSESKYCDGCSMRYNPRFLEARSFDPDFSCGKMLIRWAVSIIKSQEQRIKELDEERTDHISMLLAKDVIINDLNDKHNRLTKENKRLRAENEALAISEVKEQEIATLHAPCTELTRICASSAEENVRLMREKTALECVVATARNQAKADTVRKMQERLKAQKFTHKNLGEFVYVEDIDQIAKEMV